MKILYENIYTFYKCGCLSYPASYYEYYIKNGRLVRKETIINYCWEKDLSKVDKIIISGANKECPMCRLDKAEKVLASLVDSIK